MKTGKSPPASVPRRDFLRSGAAAAAFTILPGGSSASRKISANVR